MLRGGEREGVKGRRPQGAGAIAPERSEARKHPTASHFSKGFARGQVAQRARPNSPTPTLPQREGL